MLLSKSLQEGVAFVLVELNPEPGVAEILLLNGSEIRPIFFGIGKEAKSIELRILNYRGSFPSSTACLVKEARKFLSWF